VNRIRICSKIRITAHSRTQSVSKSFRTIDPRDHGDPAMGKV
jgi:hypothetical protein